MPPLVARAVVGPEGTVGAWRLLILSGRPITCCSVKWVGRPFSQRREVRVVWLQVVWFVIFPGNSVNRHYALLKKMALKLLRGRYEHGNRLHGGGGGGFARYVPRPSVD